MLKHLKKEELSPAKTTANVQPSTMPPESEADRIQKIRNLTKPHVASFDYFLSTGIQHLANEIEPFTVQIPVPVENQSSQPYLQFSFHRIIVQNPTNASNKSVRDFSRKRISKQYPRHARENGSSYSGELQTTILVKTSDGNVEKLDRRLGVIPIMVCSLACNLRGVSPQKLVQINEEEYEFGGYFVINGIEKVVRMIIVPRRNHAIAIQRSANRNRGPLYSEYSISMRCVRIDQTSKTVHIHYLNSGSANLRINILKAEYFFPIIIIIKALLPDGVLDSEIYNFIVDNSHDNDFVTARVVAMIKDAVEFGLEISPGKESIPTKNDILDFLGSKFRILLNVPLAMSNIDAGKLLLRRYLLIHLSPSPTMPHCDDDDFSKASVLIFMLRKLLALVKGDIVADNPDSLINQEILLPGHLYMMYLREKLEEYLRAFALTIKKDFSNLKQKDHAMNNFTKGEYIHGLISRTPFDMTKKMEYFLATGNIVSNSGLDLLQTSGYSVAAERINFLRYFSHFRCVHRGQFFTQVRTTSVRKLLPEAWGFICPVHTPDGAPCGLLNHITSTSEITQSPTSDSNNLFKVILSLGAIPPPRLNSKLLNMNLQLVDIFADGKIIASIPKENVEHFLTMLRLAKVSHKYDCLPDACEIAYIPKYDGKLKHIPGLYHGIYIFTGPARLVRPVLWLKYGMKEYIGSLEQVCLSIALDDEPIENITQKFTHMELTSMGFLSVLASMTPFSDMNQSPRNMYQCQMAKQAMGTPYHVESRRTDSKSFRLLMPQVPITRNFVMQDPMGMDAFPNGINAIVAVLSYTGYDMEDGVVINKSSLERGFGHGLVYTSKEILLDEKPSGANTEFGGNEGTGVIGIDGLPEVGTKVTPSDALYSIRTTDGTNKIKSFEYKSLENGVVEQVRILENLPKLERGAAGIRRVNVKFRHQRNPTIGDKFASRHGQKGVLSAVWPTTDMPYTENGITPDILFNPNGFPSRMTIGMMVESMSGKSGAVLGTFHDSTPFRFDEEQRATDYFGEQLLKAGYNYYGNEVMYSGYTGEPFVVDVFIGVIHYQRLRHMVNDKFQVRSLGPNNPLTRQPIKGRKVGGAIRFGEMERDALLAHGAAYLLHDRLSVCSDLHTVHVCARCGSLLSPVCEHGNFGGTNVTRITCLMCAEDSQIRKIGMPYVFKYLVNELSAMNIRVTLGIK